MSSDILSTEFSPDFVKAMQDRMVMSWYKYGPIRDGFPHKVNAVGSAEARIRKYQETGNTEFLVDAANFLMIEFMLPSHVNAHFKATDSHESPGRCTLSEDESTSKSNSELSDEQWKEIQSVRQQL